MANPLPAELERLAAAASHANVTYALVDSRLGAVSPYCEDEVVVSSAAAPSVQAGKAL